MCDLNSVMQGLIQAFENVRSDDADVKAEGFKLFAAETKDMKEAGKELADLEALTGDFATFSASFAEVSDLYTIFLSEQNQDKADKLVLDVMAEAVTDTLKESVENTKGTKTKVILSGAGVDVFCTVTNYENNREVVTRAIKQAKAVTSGKDTSSHQTGDQVAIVMLCPERNSALWERTERVCAERGIPNTLPFIKVDGHTRAYGWTTPHPKEEGATLFSRPESLFITVYMNQTDGEIYQLVQDYCNGVNKANNSELQQMGMKKIEFAPVTDFVKKDSWKTAFRTIDRKHGKDTDGAIKEFKDALMAIDNLNIETKDTTKKLSGVRAALICSFSECKGKGKTLNKWKTFWSMFYTKTRDDTILDLRDSLSEVGTGDAGKAMDLCMDAFRKYAGLASVLENQAA